MSTNRANISIRKGREWHLRRGHPWLFSGGISQAPKNLSPGDLVRLLDYDGKFVATGYYNPNCDIAVRVLSLDELEEIDRAFLEKRIKSAWELRSLALDMTNTNVFRLINAEGDFLPGFIVDFFDGNVVIQCHTAGADSLLIAFVDALNTIINPKSITIRNDVSSRLREGLSIEEPRIIKGKVEAPITVKENGLCFAVDPLAGQKTGFFTDQRDKRAAIQKYCNNSNEGAQLLNCFSYTCSFSVYAAKSGRINTVNVDQSQAALDLGRKNFDLNSLPKEKQQFVCGDAFTFLDKQFAMGSKYEIVILDPPAFAKTHKDKAKALKGYSRMVSLGLKVVRAGGLLVVCSCSGAITLEEFSECIRESAGTEGRSIQLLETFQHGADHPINLMAPEGSYLKVFFCRITD